MSIDSDDSHVSAPGWEFWVDRGGTFTDIVARAPDGRLIARKWLSDDPRYPDAALHGIAEILSAEADPSEPCPTVSAVKMGTTVGTNALLERKGAPTVLLTNRGFADLLHIGYQNRPDIFALDIRRAEPLFSRVIEVEGRVAASGIELEPLQIKPLRQALLDAYEDGFRSLAVALMHATRNPEHECVIGAIAEELGFEQVSLSHRCSAIAKLVCRGNTAVVDAYLSPILRQYATRVESGLSALNKSRDIRRATQLAFMQSHGGLCDARSFTGKDSLLSGPAGGLIGAIAVAAIADFAEVITFDMGGTSTDVAHFAGTLERMEESIVAGLPTHLPLLDIHTIAAGGGSILHFDGRRCTVGPDSAGAAPGPACYRRGGPLCITDANLMVGRLHPGYFPAVFGAAGDEPLDASRVREAFADLAARIAQDGRSIESPEATADGFLRIACTSMANAIKKISIERGHDLGTYTLCCFGAAGGQLACQVAELLGIRTVLIHPLAGVLSAYGMGLAEHRVLNYRPVYATLEATGSDSLEPLSRALEHQTAEQLKDQGIPPDKIRVTRRIVLRYAGTDSTITVSWGDEHEMRRAFAAAHRRRFGFDDPDRDLFVERIEVEGIGRLHAIDEPNSSASPAPAPPPAGTIPLYKDGSFRTAAVYRRAELLPGACIEGPALIAEETSTTVIDPGWEALVSARNHLVMRHLSAASPLAVSGSAPDPVLLEIFNQAFMSIAERMGQALQATAHSVNIKERLDFSCAIFDADGELIANAPHIPVHLGSMGESVKALIETVGANLCAGEVYLTNSPYHGGTHLPDITVVTPVYLEDQPKPAFFVASRGHHADVGGITPGSMPPNSRSIDEEGVLAEALRIVSNTRFDEQAVRRWLAGGTYPARNPDQNIADLKAQVAANEHGAIELTQLVRRYSLDTVFAYMRHVQDNAEAAVRELIATLADGEFAYTLDNEAVIRVSLQVNERARELIVDFNGSSPQRPDNLNAPAAVCRAAVLYVFRTLVQREIPLNAGCLRPLKIIIPPGCMLNPSYPAAVVAGNVETSQYIVDALYGALGVLAASQGTMNNLTFGNDALQYYETICGGAGAGPGFNGCDAVHTHMTNSRITDPEVLESRYPVRVEAFSIRRGSGGTGRYRGGCGAIRRIRFDAPMSLSILSSHRVYPPFGLKGGSPGATGRNTLTRGNGRTEDLGGCGSATVEAGDLLIIETPGGGGFGDDKPHG